MKPGRGKGKGSAFERETGRELSKWLTRGLDDKQLIRSVLSGGWRRGKVGDETWRHAGDLASNGEQGEAFRKLVAVECKHHRQIDLYGLWTKKGQLAEWWAKICQEADDAGIVPWLIFKGNMRPTMLMMRTTDFELVERGAPSVKYAADVRAVRFDAWGVTIVPLDGFLTQTDPSLIFDDE